MGRLFVAPMLVLTLALVGSLPAGAQSPSHTAQQPRIRALVISGGPFHDYILQNKFLMEAPS